MKLSPADLKSISIVEAVNNTSSTYPGWTNSASYPYNDYVCYPTSKSSSQLYESSSSRYSNGVTTATYTYPAPVISSYTPARSIGGIQIKTFKDREKQKEEEKALKEDQTMNYIANSSDMYEGDRSGTVVFGLGAETESGTEGAVRGVEIQEFKKAGGMALFEDIV